MPRDIEEFLKMAAARRAQQKKQAAGGTPPRQPPRQARPPVQQPADEGIEIISPDPGIRAGGSVAQHVQSHIDTSDIADHVRQLGEEVGLADEKLEARLHSKFDHRLGDLKIDPSRSAQSETTSVTSTQVSHLAKELVEMLRSPKSVRQAIILNEILSRRPF